MAASTYDQLVAVLSHPPDCRLHFQLDHLLPWFTKNISVFRDLKHEAIFDLIKNARFVTKEPDDVIIRQGDIGDCMYIVLRGRVTVYIHYARGDGGEDAGSGVGGAAGGGGGGRKSSVLQQPQVNKSESLRHQLGTFVTHIGPGQQFGEVALLSDIVRTASVIADEWTELIAIDRDLYFRSVRDVLKKEFEDKVRFVDGNRYFQKMAPRFRTQLTMALEKRSIPYDGVLLRQGDPVDSIYFTLTGEMKITVDPVQHQHQYPKLLQDAAIDPDGRARSQEFDEIIRKRDRSYDHTTFPAQTHRRTPIEVCLLGINKSVGDVEVLLGLKTYMQTVTCCQATDVLQLELKHYDRLFVKRNARIVDGLMNDAELCMRTRMTALARRDQHLPLFDVLLRVVERQNAVARHRERMRAMHVYGGDGGVAAVTSTRAAAAVGWRRSGLVSGGERSARPKSRTVLQSRSATGVRRAVGVQPTGGGSVDQVQRQQASARMAMTGGVSQQQQQQQQPQGQAVPLSSELLRQVLRDDDVRSPSTSRFMTSCEYIDDTAADHPASVSSASVHPACIDADVEAEQLESRLRTWLTDFGRGSQSAALSTTNGLDLQQPRVTAMRRCQTPADGLRPGVKVVIRSKRSLLDGDAGNADFSRRHYGNGLPSKKQLEYYQLALTADIPVFNRASEAV